ncbi:MAG: hypothetical protein U1F43_11930 [Myxococcota bacterium]
MLAAGPTSSASPAIYSDAIDSNNPASSGPSPARAGQRPGHAQGRSVGRRHQALGKKTAASSTPVVDARGTIFIGSNGATATDKAVFSARRPPRRGQGDAPGGATASTAATSTAPRPAIGNHNVGTTLVKFVVFGDSTGTIYSVK